MAYSTSENSLGPFTFDIEKLSQCSFEVGPIRPPSEGGSHSLLLRATRNCSWNRCRFCYGMIYNREKFELRSVEDIKKDIDLSLKIDYYFVIQANSTSNIWNCFLSKISLAIDVLVPKLSIHTVVKV